MKRLALFGKVIVKLIISGKQFNYWNSFGFTILYIVSISPMEKTT